MNQYTNNVVASHRQTIIDNLPETQKQTAIINQEFIIQQIQQIYENLQQPLVEKLETQLSGGNDQKQILQQNPTLKYLLWYIWHLVLFYINDPEYIIQLPNAIEKIKNTYTINPKPTLVPEETTNTADVFYSFIKTLPWSSTVPFSSNKLILILLALQAPDHTVDSRNPYAELNIWYIEPEFNQWLAEQEEDDEDYYATLDSYKNGETYARICFDQWFPVVRYYDPQYVWVWAPSLIRKT